MEEPPTLLSNSSAKPKLNHKKWRALQKKLKRKEKRRALAAERECNASPESEDYTSISVLTEADEQKQTQSHQAWLERERRALAEIEANKLWEIKEQKRREEEDRKIKEEWEERQKLEKEEEERHQEEEAERKKRHEKLLKEATANENTGDEWHNPLAPPVSSSGKVQERAHCPFFAKVGACRFGDRCSRFHDLPESSQTLLFPNMYSHFQLDQGLFDEYDSDLVLEYEDTETYQHFKDFYRDVLPEFKRAGRVVQFKVCCNYEPHLRGNVYVQFENENEAMKAYMALNGRWYAGKQLSCEFSNVTKWKNAICGLFHQKRCPKGKNCNFLHVFRNPGNEYREADYDFENSSKRPTDQRHRRSYAEYSERLQRSRSPSQRRSSTRHRSRSRTQDRSSRTTLSRSRSRERSSRSKSYRTRSRSPVFRSSRHRTRSRSRERSSRTRESTRDRDISRNSYRSSSVLSTQLKSDRHAASQGLCKKHSSTTIEDELIQSPPTECPPQGSTQRDSNPITLPNSLRKGDAGECNSDIDVRQAKELSTENMTSSDESSENEEALRNKLLEQLAGKQNGGPERKVHKSKKKHKKHKHKHKKHKRKDTEMFTNDET